VKAVRLRWVGYVVCMEVSRGAYSVGKPERRRPLGSPRHRWEDDIKMGLQEIGCVGAAITTFMWCGIGTCGGILWVW